MGYYQIDPAFAFRSRSFRGSPSEG